MKYLWAVIVALTTLGFASCSDDDGDAYPGGNGAVRVDKVYLLDADANTTEREVTFARLGQTLLLKGEGFGGTKKLLVNGYETYFSTALVTNTSMIVQLQSKTPVSEADEDVRNKIQFVKESGTYSYDFTIRAASPSITSISNTMPKAGETVIVYGANLQETTQVTLPGGTVISAEAITNAPKDESGEWFSFVMPEGVEAGGSLSLTCANGDAVSPEYFNNKNTIILDFDGNGTQGFWSWSETGSMINADDLVDDPLNSGRGKVHQVIPQRLLTAGVAAGKSRATECWTAGAGNAADDWTWMTEFIPATTPLAEVAFQFDVYVPEDWSGTGHLQVSLINNYNFGGIGSDDDGSSNSVAFWCPWIDGGEVVPFKTTGWQTVTIPFSEFNKYAAEIEDGKTPTFQEVIDDRNNAKYPNFGIGFVNTDFTYNKVEVKASVCKQLIYTDNWRVVPCKSVTVSDFPDEDTDE